MWGNAVGSPPTRSPSLSGLGAGELTRQRPSLLALAGRPKVVPFPFLHTTRMEDAMKLRYALAMAALSSTAVGMAVHTLHAQGKPPVYMVAMNEITDPEGYRNNTFPMLRRP